MCPLILPTGCDVLCFDTVDFFLSHSLFFFFFFKLNIFYRLYSWNETHSLYVAQRNSSRPEFRSGFFPRGSRGLAGVLTSMWPSLHC